MPRSGESDVRHRALQLLKNLKAAPVPDYVLMNVSNVRDVEPAQAIFDSDPEVQAAIVREIVDQIADAGDAWREPMSGSLHTWVKRLGRRYPLNGIAVSALLLHRKLPFSDEDIVWIVNRISDMGAICEVNQPLVSGLAGTIEKRHAQSEISLELADALQRFIDVLPTGHSDLRKACDRLVDLLAGPDALPLAKGEAWSDVAIADITQMNADQSSAWLKLIKHCRKATAARPSRSWLANAQALIDAVSVERFTEHVVRWFPLVDKPRTEPVKPSGPYDPDPNQLIIDRHAEILKGLCWCCGFQEHAAIARTLGDLARSAYRKVPGLGPRAVKIGNAAVWALGAMPGMPSIGQLALLRIRVKFGTAQKGIEQSLIRAAERVGMPVEELEEMAVPAYGLSEVGLLREQFGEFTAELNVTGTISTELRWLKADGKPQKSIPAAVKRDFADDLKALKQSNNDIQKMLPAQRDRIDLLHLQRKVWPFETWRQRYLDHPLVGVIARRTIWRLEDRGRSTSAVFYQGQLVSRDGRTVDWAGDETKVELWHPIGREINEILEWRNWLEAHEVRQPFKQAHREVYLLTDAERKTNVYSNRFAAHFLRQHQFNALCAVRGWKNKLRLFVDDAYAPPTLYLPQWNLRAEFWVEGAGDEYGEDTNDAGVFNVVVTDQVRFYPIDAAQRSAHASGGGYYTHGEEGSDNPVPLEEIPPLVLSEVMRDVDLFVGVASIGNDPAWSDGGAQGRYATYWAEYSFGELGENAKTRRQVLERIIPRLQIAERCAFAERFLVVKGDLRTYKIHFGSGNILMEPNDQYLCIVAAQSGSSGLTSKVFLPFEGDGQLAVILSKAILLADDKRIKDPTILRQIRAGR